MTRALVVDDSRAMRSILTRILSSLGMEVVEAEDGQSALAKLQQFPPFDVALVDWHMPGMTGLELISDMHRQPKWRSVAIMMVTTESDQSQIVRALNAGAHEYLVKPFTADAVAEKLLLLGVKFSKGNGSESTMGGNN